MNVDLIIEIAALVLTVGGALIANNRWLVGRIDKGDEDLAASMRRIHERIDEIPNIYVRREDLMDHLRNIERGQSETNRRLDSLTTAILEHLDGRRKEEK